MCQFARISLWLMPLMGIGGRSLPAWLASLADSTGVWPRWTHHRLVPVGLQPYGRRVAELAHHPVTGGHGYVPVIERRW